MKEPEFKYKPDWQDRNFLKFVPKKIQSLSNKEKELIRKTFVDIFNLESKYITDRQSQSHHLMCAYILASYNQLIEKGIEKSEAIEELTKALKKFGGRFIQWSMKIMLWTKKDKQKFIENAAIQKSKETYGKSFKIEEEKKEKQFTSIVRKCGYFDFFNRNGVPGLTKIFCGWDLLWADEINKQNCGIRFKRPTTIANNDSDCRFEFHYRK